ncbi:MAG: hypothetical protein RI943_995 [Bacteroidota bacterium]|jgi:hypothetical protein
MKKKNSDCNKINIYTEITSEEIEYLIEQSKANTQNYYKRKPHKKTQNIRFGFCCGERGI